MRRAKQVYIYNLAFLELMKISLIVKKVLGVEEEKGGVL